MPATSSSSPSWVCNNVFAHGEAWGLCVHDVPFIRAENNTFAHIAYHGAGFRGSSYGNVVINNIVLRHGLELLGRYWGDEGGEVTGDHNLIFEANPPDPAGPHDLVDVDPQLVADLLDDFRLLPGSPAVDAGTALAEVRVLIKKNSTVGRADPSRPAASLVG